MSLSNASHEFFRHDCQEPGAQEGGQHLAVLLVYEDLSTGLRARHAFEGVVRQLELEADFDLKVWKFALLGEPALLEQAAKEAEEADIVFLAAHGDAELPVAIKLWLARWLAHKGREPCALAVSLDPSAGDAPAAGRMVESLRAAVQPAGVEMFLHRGEAPRVEPEITIEGVRLRAEAQTAVLEEMLRRLDLSSYREWGINE